MRSVGRCGERSGGERPASRTAKAVHELRLLPHERDRILLSVQFLLPAFGSPAPKLQVGRRVDSHRAAKFLRVKLQGAKREETSETLSNQGDPLVIEFMLRPNPRDRRANVREGNPVNVLPQCLAVPGAKSGRPAVVHLGHEKAHGRESLRIAIEAGFVPPPRTIVKINQQGWWVDERHSRQGEVAGEVHTFRRIEGERRGGIDRIQLHLGGPTDELHKAVLRSVENPVAAGVRGGRDQRQEPRARVIPVDHLHAPAGEFPLEFRLNAGEFRVQPLGAGFQPGEADADETPPRAVKDKG